MSQFSTHRRSQRRAHSLSSDAAAAVASAASFTLESLELRRMLSAASSYDLQAHLVQQPNQLDRTGFGATVATNGNLALIGAPGVGSSLDYQGNPIVGGARLVDTSTGQTLRVFDDPGAQTVGDAFGQSVAFVNGKIAIAQGQNYSGGEGKVYIYDDANDLTPTVCITPTILNNGSSFATNMCAVGNDLYVTIAQYNGGGSQSAIVKYDSSTGLPTHTYFNPLTTGNDNFGAQLAVQGTNIYATAIGPNGASIYKLNTTNDNISLFTDANGGDTNFGFTLAASPSSLYVATSSNSVLQLDTNANVVNTLTPPPGSGSVYGGFGESLAVGTDILIVGNRDAFEDVNNSIQGGEAYVYDLATGNYAATILNPTPENYYLNNDPMQGQIDQFSWAVAPLPGGKFLVTDPTDDTNGGTSPGGPYDTGSVYVYAPHVTNQPPTASVSAPASTNENTTVTLDASGSTDPDGPADITLYEWDLNNDGKFDDATGVTVNFTQDLPGNYPVAIRVTDTAGHQSVASTSVQFIDIPATADAGADQSGTAGTPVNFSGSGTTAPGDAITSYQWNFNYDGVPADFTADASGANTSHTYAAAGTYTAALRVTDDDGQTAIDTQTVTVNPAPPVNHAPTNAQIAGQANAVRQQSITFTGSYSDVDAGDTHQVTWNFGDGNTIAYHPDTDAGALTPSHAYVTAGSFTVTMTVKDAAGATASATFAVTVTATGLQGTTLYVGGTSGNNVIDVVRASNGRLKASIDGSAFEFFQNVTQIVLLGGDGNDDMSVGTGVVIPADMFGGTGADTLLGGGGSDFLDGGSGDDDVKARGGDDIAEGGDGADLVTGGEGRDFLIGGEGADKILGNADDDILVAGTTSYDGNRIALNAIKAEWLSTRTYAQRVANIRDGSGTPTRNNGSYFLTADVTVFDDNAKDTLTGGQNEDWFLANTDNTAAIDKITDLKAGEFADDLDTVV